MASKLALFLVFQKLLKKNQKNLNVKNAALFFLPKNKVFANEFGKICTGSTYFYKKRRKNIKK